MTHSHRVFYRASLRLVIMILVTICGCSLFPSSLSSIEYVFSYAVYPLLWVQKAIVDQAQYYAQRRKDTDSLQQLVHDLTEQCESLRSENIQLRALTKYAEDIGEVREFREKYASPSESRIVRIMLRSLTEREQYILVDGGRNRGITRDMVAVYKNCLVGKVEQVYKWYSKVRLVTDESCKVAVYGARSRINGIYQGCNDCDKAFLQYVPHFEMVMLNDTLISSGEGMIFPQGFSVGSVQSCQKNGLHYDIRVKPDIDVQALSYCVLLSR